jgi:DNA sulfur modification protein DndC
MFEGINASLQEPYLEDERPWLVGFSDAKDSTMLAALVFDVALSIPAEQRQPTLRR